MGKKIEEFQRLLTEITAAAKEKGGRLSVGEVKKLFGASGLDREQMKKVLQYLKLQGISIEGTESEEEHGGPQAGTKETRADKKAVPLTAQEREYLAGYRRELSAYEASGASSEELFQALAAGETSALEELTRRYLPVAAELAEAENCGEIPFQDLLQEANLSLLAALDEREPLRKSDAWVRGRILEGIRRAIEEQTERKFSDDYLVSKVEKLDRTIRELTEGEDGEKSRLSVQELSVILDMDAEEIRDVLRLAGEGE